MNHIIDPAAWPAADPELVAAMTRWAMSKGAIITREWFGLPPREPEMPELPEVTPGARQAFYAALDQASARRPDVHDHEEHRDGTVPGCPACKLDRQVTRHELEWLLDVIPVVDQHLDDAAPPEYRDNPLANMWRRFSAGPVSEAAEAIDALNGMTGGNPRKGITHSRTDLLAEAADTAFSSLLAIQSQTKDIAATWTIFIEAAAKAYSRVPDEYRKTLAGYLPQEDDRG